ncbi:MAG: uracil-DNA glycosylase [Gammaproteobacteria bacterium]|nr:uracil-DNA glycosylase [Gammaproteobacteria bacterium]
MGIRNKKYAPGGRPFEPACGRCPRLSGHLAEVAARYPDYHAAPVASFGDPRARLLVVGLAPGMHGANATGRPFTGDHAGILLYQTLHAFGFASAPESLHATDGLRLHDCRITNAVRCLPPQNRPTGEEVRTCNAFLRWEIDQLPADGLLLALGVTAHGAVLRAAGLVASRYPFRHGKRHLLPDGRELFDCYHCSRYNTQTRRLTPVMFRAVFRRLRQKMS